MTLTNQRPPREADDDLLTLFVTGRGHVAFRSYVRNARLKGWPRTKARFVLQALYARLSVIMRDGGATEHLVRFLRVLQETETECDANSSDLGERVASLSEFVTDLINHDGGPNSANILSDPAALLLLQHLAAIESGRLDEADLAALVPDRGQFNQAIFSLLVSGLITWLDDDDKAVFSLSEKGRFRLGSLDHPDPFEKLRFGGRDIFLYTPILPVFDMMALTFATALMDDRERYPVGGVDRLKSYGVEVKPRIRQTSLDNWLNLDELFLDPLSRVDSDIGAILMARPEAASTVDPISMNITVGNTFVGYHLLIANSALEHLHFPQPLRRTPPLFPSSVEEMQSLVPWAGFGAWLNANGLRAVIYADEGTQPLLEILTDCLEGHADRFEIRHLESNSGRLAALGPPTDGVLRVALATGPLLAIAEQAGLSILTTSWDMLRVARDRKRAFESVSRAVLRQYVHVAIPRREFEESFEIPHPEVEDHVYRVAGFLEQLYRIIAENPDAYASYCLDQWNSLRSTFPMPAEFEFDLREADVLFAITASYRWVGQDLSFGGARQDWPVADDLRAESFWRKECDAYWPKVQARREDLRARIVRLHDEVVALIGPADREDVRALAELVSGLRAMGALRTAEQGLVHAISCLKTRAGAPGD